MAYSGIASTLLINGATAHSTFQIPIPLLPDSTCNMKRQSARAQILRDTTIFIWDEASMIPANALKAVDVLLRDITQADKPFGGKFMFLGGDFRQVLPVIPRVGREQTAAMHHTFTPVASLPTIPTGNKHESSSRSHIQTVF